MTSIFDNGSIPHDPVLSLAGASGINYLIKEKNVGRVKATTVVQQISAQGATSNIFVTPNGILNFLLNIGTGNVVDVCRNLVFEFTVTNTGASAMTLMPVPYWINNIQVLSAGSVLETLYSESLSFVDELFLMQNDEHILALQSLENFSYSNTTGYATNSTTLAAGASKTYFFNLYCCINRCQFMLSAVNSQIALQFQFNAAPYTIASTSTTISMTGAQLIMSGYRYEDSVRNKLLDRYARNVTLFSYWQGRKEVQSNVALSNSNTTSVQITNFSGQKLACLFVGARPSGAVQDNQYNFDLLSQIDLKNAGSSVFLNGLNYREYTYMTADSFPSSAFYSSNFFCMPFSIDCYNSLRDGLMRGNLELNPNYSLYILDSVSATREIVVLGYQLSKVYIKGGNLYLDAL